MAATTFTVFRSLPKELRDSTWELCLPRRILEVDHSSIDHMFLTRYALRGDVDYDGGHQSSATPVACSLKHTTRANSGPPVLTKVCRESRAVALRSGGLWRGFNENVPPNDQLFNTTYEPVDEFWFDPVRDTLHLHWQPFASMLERIRYNQNPSTVPLENLVSVLRQLYDGNASVSRDSGTDNGNASGIQSISIDQRLRRPGQKVLASITDDLLDTLGGFGERNIIRLVASHKEWLVCGAVVVMHVKPEDERKAIQSGLWGLLGDERVVTIDAFDAALLRRYRQFWNTYGSARDRLAAEFFNLSDALGDGASAVVHYAELPHHFVEDLRVRWLLNAPLWAPDVDDAGGPGPGPGPGPASETHHPANSEAANSVDHRRHRVLPGDRLELWLATPHKDLDLSELRQSKYDFGEPFVRQMWKPNPHHPWIQDKMARMPVFRPTVMFRLCTDDCLTTCKSSSSAVSD
ncbi:hypothetical protein BD289DRAFT_455701 [Coniella lustricola]|uniref:2EXR domain-containing protein n=1 Tax=Coniella lustricola TaxID=2025994 RepID=A0A2T2ZYT8_9PEZI|nr:hypothetical protein BD289DRAFT_455701 [Coniella lustricola]